jgi:DNA-binding response OmpR family regulator
MNMNSTHNHSILLVEDDEKLSGLIAKFLEKNGLQVETEFRGDTAVSKILQLNPDLVVLDVMLPGLDGFETTEIILKDPDSTDIPIVMCTGKESEEDKKKALDLGAFGYLPKSSSPEPLQKILEEVNQRQVQAVVEPEMVATVVSNDFDFDEYLEKVSKESKSISENIAKNIASTTANEVANTVTNQLITAQVDSLIAQFEQKIMLLTEKVEQNVVSEKASDDDLQKALSEKIAQIETVLIPAIKVDFGESIKISVNDLKDELKKEILLVKENDTNNERIEAKVQSLDNNLTKNNSLLLDNEAKQVSIEANFQQKMTEQEKQIQSLEALLAKKANSGLNIIGIAAFLLGAIALAVSIIPLLK